ncbi:glycogen synthase [Shewanella algae]|uniref:glycogen synthase n=1 Tax=Shewanella algae TaxID=38313 RepID=UPI001FB96021|nr:glycogen/starch synthase [Shewanella algae]
MAAKVKLQVLMLAAENAALAGAKVGGMADVLAELPPALQSQGVAAHIIMPDYGFLAKEQGADFLCEFEFAFGAGTTRARLFRIANPAVQPDSLGMWIYLLAHEGFCGVKREVYSLDGPERPFATDAGKFALFGAAVAAALKQGLLPLPDRFHLHDWHCGGFAMLRALDPAYRGLSKVPCVLSIHNLAMQGVRPLAGEASSLAAWYPWLLAEGVNSKLQLALDTRYPGCINPLRAAIQFCDVIHLVSATYAKEVLRPSQPELGFFGGEGLEADLQAKAKLGQVFGILNGCDYQKGLPLAAGKRQQLKLQLSKIATEALLSKLGRSEAVTPADMIAQIRLGQISESLGMLLTSVGRLTEQKLLLLCHPWQGKTVLEELLLRLAQFSDSACFWLLGSGDEQIAALFGRIAASNSNFRFINGYHQELADALYQCGDLFVMPSSFEPCGISQMLALRAGQPCLVHATGGLADTLSDGDNGLVFAGIGLDEQAKALLDALSRALELYSTANWNALRKSASASRFSWQDSARLYLTQLYQVESCSKDERRLVESAIN